MATHLPDEAQLVTAARSGNAEALGLLIMHYYRNIYHLAIKITRNHEDAEDVLQEASLKAHCKLKQFHGNSRFYTWLVRITVNEALMKLRKKRNERVVPLGEAVASGNGFVLPQFQDWSKHPERFYSELELEEVYRRALVSLSPALAEALILRNIEELSMKEAAAALRLSPSALKSRLVRARSRMRKRLNRMIWGQSLTRDATSSRLPTERSRTAGGSDLVRAACKQSRLLSFLPNRPSLVVTGRLRVITTSGTDSTRWRRLPEND
ncbi:MAG TPA: sigma-70 family RNA polymerase sigma factor [Terriglobia bacterium]|nr:sigma-70 family RNA polymerase sigma factor [Terriglobia bacterium]